MQGQPYMILSEALHAAGGINRLRDRNDRGNEERSGTGTRCLEEVGAGRWWPLERPMGAPEYRGGGGAREAKEAIEARKV